MNCLLVAPRLRHPNNRVQRVIQKVRVYLRLKHFKLAAALLLLLLNDVLHQMAHRRYHRADGMPQPLNLVAALLLNFHILAARFKLLDSVFKTAYWVGDMGGNAKVQICHQKYDKQQ